MIRQAFITLVLLSLLACLACMPRNGAQVAVLAAALDASGEVWTQLDALEADGLRSIDVATDAQLKAATIRVARLRAAHDTLIAIRGSQDPTRMRSQLVLLVTLLRIAVDSARAVYDFPPEATAAISTFEALAAEVIQ